jgi:hypothetical protein
MIFFVVSFVTTSIKQNLKVIKMKRILLSVFCAFLLASTGSAQFSNLHLPEGTTRNNLKVFQLPKKLLSQLPHHSSGRAAADTFLLDYPEVDNYNATAKGIDFIPNYAESINERYDSSNTLAAGTVGVLFDTIIVADPNTGDYTKSIPFNKAQLTLDTVYIIYNFGKVPTNLSNSTLTINVYKFPIALSNNGGYNSEITSVPVYTKTYTDTPLLQLQTAPTALRILSVPVGYTFNKGERFFVAVSYDADTASDFSVGCAFADSCQSNQLLLRRSTLPGRSWYYVNFGSQSGWDNGTLSVPTMPVSCRYWLWQNWQIIPLVRANVDFGVSAKASKNNICPGDQITLTANGFGSNDISYQWFTSRGTLSTPNDKETNLTTDSTTTVFVVATDNTTNAKDTARLTINYRGINISINGGQPVQINCGQKGTLTATLTGFTSGQRTFVWRGPTGPDTTTTSSSLGNLLPGNYSVTVTNSAGCTASTTASIIYPNINNNVSFTVTPDVSPAAGIQVCINRPATFTNTSSGQNGWNATWFVGNNEVGFGNTFSYTFPAVGQNNVRLQIDSANCILTSTTTVVNVLSASNSACVSSVSDMKFESSISLLPNPASANVALTVNGAEKPVTVKIYNVIGSVVAQYQFSETGGTIVKNITLDNFASGTYLVKVESNGKTAIKRLIINH